MLKFLTAGVLATTLGFGGAEAAQACGGGRCCVRTCAPACAPSCAAPAAAPAPMGHEGHAVPAPPPEAPQASTGTYRRYSYEPSMAAPVYRAPVRNYGSSNQFDAGRKIRGEFGKF